MRAVRCMAFMFACAAVPAAASAAKVFAGPGGWNHVVSGTPGAARSQDVWKSSDGASADVVSVLSDGSARYEDILAAVRANAAAGGTHLSVDRDRTCDGRVAHTFEMTFGPPEGKKALVNQTVVNDGTGSTRITYSRADGAPFSPDVKAALATYCGE